MLTTIAPATPLCLGSASPRRRELLTGLGVPIRVVVADIDEQPSMAEAPLDYLGRVVLDKLGAIAQQTEAIRGCAALLVADTIVRIDDRIINKPRDLDDALVLLQLLCGREHLVHTRYAIATQQDFARPIVERTVTPRVFLRASPIDLLKRYVATREGLDKAGAYAAQGIGAFLIERINGSYTNVVGLPLCETIEDLMANGLLRCFP